MGRTSDLSAVEAFPFFETNLKMRSLTLPAAKPPFSITVDDRIPSQPPPKAIQTRDVALLEAQTNGFSEGTDLMGTPKWAAQPSWVSSASVQTAAILPDPERSGGGQSLIGENTRLTIRRECLPPSSDQVNIPLWF